MKLLKLIPAAAIALTAFTTFEAKAGYPSGWSRVGDTCDPAGEDDGLTYTKLQKNSDNSLYGVWEDMTLTFSSEWIKKDITLQEANQKMNNKCDTNSYQPTS